MAIKRTPLADFSPDEKKWMQRRIDEQLRNSGQMRTLVLRMLTRGEDPTRDDVANAWDENPDVLPPQPILDYVRDCFVRESRLRKTGPKAPRSTWTDFIIMETYLQHLASARDEREADGERGTRAVKTVASERTAAECGVSIRIVAEIVHAFKARRLPK